MLYKKKCFHLRLILNVNEFNYIFTELLIIQKESKKDLEVSNIIRIFVK